MNAPLASLEGALHIHLKRVEDGHCVPTITSSRPFNLPRAFVGKPIDQVAHQVGLLFSLCGRAQQAACLGALERASGRLPNDATLQARHYAVEAERIREQALKRTDLSPDILRSIVSQSQTIARDAAPAFKIGGAAEAAFVEACREGLVSLKKHCLGGAPEGADVRETHGVRRLEAGELNPPHLMPTGISDSGLADAPTINGQPRWTAYVPTGRGDGLYAFQDGEDGWGIATVMTARGLLTHAARTDGDHVTAYRIIAPTEWNFHPDGLVARTLAKLTPEDNWASAARELVDRIDPCVAATISVDGQVSHA